MYFEAFSVKSHNKPDQFLITPIHFIVIAARLVVRPHPYGMRLTASLATLTPNKYEETLFRH